MNRDHKVFTFSVECKVEIRVWDDFQDSRITGYERKTIEVVVIATSEGIARAALIENPFLYVDPVITLVSEKEITHIIERHTY